MPAPATLHAWLSQHRPLDASESRHRDRMLELIDTAAEPCSRHHFVPGHFTASGFVLSPDERALLLIYHRKLERWLQPGGHVEPDDHDLLASARREVAEETGLTAVPLAWPSIFDLDVHSIPPLGKEPAHEHFDVRFLFRARDLRIEHGDEVAAARFVPLRELEDGSSDRSVMRIVRKLL